MLDFYNCLMSEHGISLGIGAFLFIITLLLASRRVIGFTLTLLFLLITLSVSLVVEYHSQIFSYFTGKAIEEIPQKPILEEPTLEKSPLEIPSTDDNQKTEPVEKTRKAPETSIDQQPVQQEEQPAPKNQPAAPTKQQSPYIRGQADLQRQRVDEFLENQSERP